MLLKETAPPDGALALPPASRPETITLDGYGHLGWRRASNFAFARHLAAQPLAADEIARVAQSMPVAIRRDRDAWTVVAIFADTADENVYVDQQGRWLGAFVPAGLRVFPFCLSPEVPGTLALWPGHEPQALDDRCEPFFIGGELAPVLTRTLQLLRRMRASIAALAEPLAFLADRGVLSEWHLPPRTEGSSKPPLSDIWRVDAERFEALGDSDWLTLRRMRALPWIHAHLASIHHVARFQRVAAVSAEPRAATSPRSAPAPKATAETEDFLALLAADMNGSGT